MTLKDSYDVVVIGSGPGGLAAAISAKKNGARDVLIIERDLEPGGILNQCIHHGFGLELLGQDYPGPAYAQRLLMKLEQKVWKSSWERWYWILHPSEASSPPEKPLDLSIFKAGQLYSAWAAANAPGRRSAFLVPDLPGCYTAGTAQRWVNVEGYMPGKKYVILGSGDIGMIMARRLTLEGAMVDRVMEVMPFLTGLTRNYVQCLMDNKIPLQLGRTVNRMIGDKRVEAIESVQVNDKWQPIAGTEEIIPCDTLLLSVGLIPENELSRKAGVRIDPITGGPFVDDRFETNVPGVFAAGNVVHVYDLVDWVTEAGYAAGKSAARFARETRRKENRHIPLLAGENVRYVVPHELDKESLAEGEVRLQLRVKTPIEKPCWVEVHNEENLVVRKSEPYARPGEIITMELTPRCYDDVIDAHSLTVSVFKR